jgi:uncharacterized membrane protein
MNLDRNLRFFTIIITAVGLIDSLYLTWIKLSHNEALCLPGVGNCETVNSSQYATIAGMPVAVVGAVGYLTILALLILENTPGIIQENGRILVFGLGLIGVIFSGYLTYIEIAVLHAICPFCVLSAIAMLIIFGISTYRLMKNQI